MAWIVKPSASLAIARRETPYVDDAMAQHIRTEIMPRYATGMAALLPVLHLVQETHGYIPHQAMEEVAAVLGITPADVLDTVSFYEEFRDHPAGTYVIGICQSIACEVCGHETLLDHLRERLGVEPHETTADGRFTLLTMECLGSCDTAPVALVNETLHEHLTLETIDEIIDRLQRES